MRAINNGNKDMIKLLLSSSKTKKDIDIQNHVCENNNCCDNSVFIFVMNSTRC